MDGRAGPHPAVWVVALDLVVVVGGNTLPAPLFPAYREAWGISAGATTLVFACTIAGIVLTLAAGGRVSDQVGRRPVLCVTLAVALAGALVGLVAHGLGALLAARAIQGLAAGLIAGTATAAIRELAGTTARGARITALASVGGLMTGLVIGGALAQHAPHPLRLPWAVQIAMLALALAATWRLLPETVRERGPLTLRPQRLAAPAAERARFVLLSLVAMLAFACISLLAALGATFVLELVGIRDVLLGAGVAVLAYAVSCVAQTLAGGRRTALPAGVGLLVAGLALLAVAARLGSIGLLLAAAATIGAGHGATFASTLAAVDRMTAEHERAGTASTYFLVTYLGITLPVLGVGALADRTSLATATTAFAALTAALLLALAAPGALRTRA